MTTTLSQSTSAQELSSESEHGALTAEPQDAVMPLSNGTTGGKNKLITKPPPPAQPKPSRFLKNKSLTFTSLPRFGKNTASSKVQEGNTEPANSKDDSSTSKRLLRESPLWKLPGISTLKKNRRHSSAIEANMQWEECIPPRQAVTPPENRKNSTNASSSTTLHQPARELPPLPTIPPLGVPITVSSTDSQSGTTTDTNHYATLEEGNEDIQIPNDREHYQNNELSPSHSAQSLTLQVDSIDVPKSSSTPRSTSVQSLSENEQVEKADTIHSIIAKYHLYVPIRIRVLQGYCSDTADINISTGDLYDVQLMKTTKVVTIRDQDGMTLRVPLESSTKFGLVFNLSSNYDEGLCGYTFRTVSDLTSLSTLPRVVCTVKAFEGNDSKSSVQQNEILVVQQALKSVFRGKRGIKVYSLLTRTEKILPEDCDAGLSTNPSLVRMHLPDIIEHIVNPFPAHAVMYPTTDNTEEDMPGTMSRVITMLEYSAKESLTVSAVVGESDETSMDESTFFEIPLDEDMKEIEVSVLQWTTPPESPELEDKEMVSESSSYDDDEDHVYDDTINLIQTSDTLRNLTATGQHNISSSDRDSHPGHSGVTPPLPDKPKWLSNQPHHNVVVEGSHSNEVAVNEVTTHHDNVLRSLPAVPSDRSFNHQVSEEEDPSYDTIGAHLMRKRGVDNETSSFTTVQYDTSESGDPRIVSWMEDLQTTTNTLESRLTSLEHSHKNAKDSNELARMRNSLEQMAQKIDSLDSQLQSLMMSSTQVHFSTGHGNKPPGESGRSASDAECNIDYLRSLDVGKMCGLIEAMGLGQYKNKFKSERISGEIFLECDEQMLRDELGIQSRIHCVRLTKLISGLHSARQYLDN